MLSLGDYFSRIEKEEKRLSFFIFSFKDFLISQREIFLLFGLLLGGQALLA